MGEWRDIADYDPKSGEQPFDGYPVLLRTFDGDHIQGHWDPTRPNFYKSMQGSASYDPENMMGEWVSFWVPLGCTDNRLFCGCTPTHWMPLPDSPVTEHDDGRE